MMWAARFLWPLYDVERKNMRVEKIFDKNLFSKQEIGGICRIREDG